ncbi:MAG TPA: imelysin family protein [Polyangiaceae bacterium]|nr:imelysin family protein [Polyangiaceae bacterium]
MLRSTYLSAGRIGRLPFWGLAASVTLAVAASCKTATPDELYVSASVGPTPHAGVSNGSGGNPSGSGVGNGARPTEGGSSSQSGADLGGAPIESPAGDGGRDATEPGPGPDLEPDPVFDCGPGPVIEGGFSRAALRDAAGQCAMWQYCRFEGAASALARSVEAHREVRSEATLAAARDAWRVAMGAFSRLELFQYGPFGSNSESAGRDPVHGQGLHDLIYSWPSVARCRVEEQVVGRAYEASWTPVLVSARGLFGLEYLLFYPGSDHACTPTSSTAKLWAALDAEQLARAKLDYAGAISDNVLATIQKVRSAWSPEGGNFAQTLINAGGYESEQQALNVIAWSLIYIEREVKDWKVGIAAGHTLTAPVTLAETPYAGLGITAIRENLAGFRALFQGCGEHGAGLGFDDWLREVGQEQLGSDIVSALDGAELAAREFPAFDRASPEQLEAFYQALRVLTALLKTDLFGAGSSLNLKLPAGVASDTD